VGTLDITLALQLLLGADRVNYRLCVPDRPCLLTVAASVTRESDRAAEP
jgi:hypothetical protein